MGKQIHNDVRDKGLEQVSVAANWGGGAMNMVVCAGVPANATEAATLYPAGKRVSGVIAMIEADFTLGNKAGGGREVVVGAKSDTAGATVVNADAGTATGPGGGTNTLADTTKAWGVDAHAAKVVKITGGTGAGQSATIVSNTAAELIIDVNWVTPPDPTSTYEIREDLVVALYDGGGTPRVLAVINDSVDAEIANGSTLNVPSFAFGIGAAA